eukprot:TRINITY_DN61310_c0_g1_i1.p1 TRINITY_DN61310_c0_g1~~TRINITY_DN61310_c0_g1_i1.p1  ORF type:complete len:455 (+),score=63.64 TRINITY_DN61310_c0_g1_i1:72-1436(+)
MAKTRMICSASLLPLLAQSALAASCPGPQAKQQGLLQVKEEQGRRSSEDPSMLAHIISPDFAALVHGFGSNSGLVASWTKSHMDTFVAVMVCFMTSASVSIGLRHARQTESAQDRDKLWDIAKLILMFCVIDLHTQSCFANATYEFFLMPGFLMMSGFLQQKSRGGVLDAQAVKRVFRDNILNNLLIFLVATAGGMLDKEDGTLWFLWALAIYRLFIFPLFSKVKEVSGPIGVVALVFAFAVSYRYTDPHSIKWAYLANCLLLNTNIGFKIPWHAFYYVLGLSLDYTSVRQTISRAPCVALSLVFMFVHRFYLVNFSSWVTTEGFVDNPLKWFQLLYCSLISLAFMSCLTPLADRAQGLLLQVAEIMADLGSRSLYAYCLHMLMRFLITDDVFTGLADDLGPVGSLPRSAMQVLFLVSLSSPLAEKCFSWLVSPQWAVDLVSSVGKALLPGWKQ